MTHSFMQTLWTLGEWRCEVHALGVTGRRLRLFRNSELIAEHQASRGFIQDYAEIWRAAIADLSDAKVDSSSRITHTPSEGESSNP